MKNSKKRLISASLLICLLLASCGSEGNSGGNETTDGTSEKQEDTTTEELTDGLENVDYGGAEFNIVYSADQLGNAWPYDAETETGDLLSDSVYKRNHAVGDRFNVSVSYINTGGVWDEVPKALMKSVNAGDTEYHLAISHTYSSVPVMLAGGYLADFLTMPNIDVSKPWWNASIKENLSICGVLPIAVSDLVYSYADVIYVNQDMTEKFGLENPYDLVYDGKWTWTKLAEIAESVASDLNGDGVPSDGDIFGYTTPGETPSLMSRIVQSNGMLMAKSNGGSVELLQMSDRLQNSFERYYSLLYDGIKTYIGTVTGDKESVTAFADGNILFMHQTTLQLPKLRDTEVNFGIVPLPKYDEAQENYSSMLSSQILLIPGNLDDETKEFAGRITEALSYESWKTVTPAVYNSIFESKYLRDATSYEMYQMIRSSLVCDFNWNYGNGNELTTMAIYLLKEKKSTDVASYLAKHSDKIAKSYAELVENVTEIYG